MPKTLKNQAKPLYRRQFLWFSHIYTRCGNPIEKGNNIEAQTTPNPLKNDTKFEHQKQSNKKRHKNELETTMCRKVLEKGLKKNAILRRN